MIFTRSNTESMKLRVDRWKDPVVAAYKRGIDKTLLRENLRLSHHQRVRRLIELQRFAAELRAAGARAMSR